MRRARESLAAAVLPLLLAVLGAACAGDDARPRDSATGDTGVAAPSANLSARATQRCDAPDVSGLIDSAGIGPVLLRMPVSTLASRCTVADTTVSREGMPERAHVISVGGRSVLALSTGTPDTSLIRVITVDPTFKTAGGVGVGSSVESLRRAQGEGNFVVSAVDVPGVSFAIDWSPPPSREPSAAETPFPGGDPGTALDASRIIRIWVHGVTGGCRVGVG
jgi:hypothetical protein